MKLAAEFLLYAAIGVVVHWVLVIIIGLLIVCLYDPARRKYAKGKV